MNRYITWILLLFSETFFVNTKRSKPPLKISRQKWYFFSDWMEVVHLLSPHVLILPMCNGVACLLVYYPSLQCFKLKCLWLQGHPLKFSDTRSNTYASSWILDYFSAKANKFAIHSPLHKIVVCLHFKTLWCSNWGVEKIKQNRSRHKVLLKLKAVF